MRDVDSSVSEGVMKLVAQIVEASVTHIPTQQDEDVYPHPSLIPEHGFVAMAFHPHRPLNAFPGAKNKHINLD